MKPTTLTKSECVRRARNINQQSERVSVYFNDGCLQDVRPNRYKTFHANI